MEYSNGRLNKKNRINDQIICLVSIILNYLKLVYIYNFTILIKPMENLETAKVPKDKFILLIDNRQDQRLIKINDNK